MKHSFWIVLSGLIIWGCQSQKNTIDSDTGANNLFDLNSIKLNMNFLASDELEGREAGTNSEKVASLFIVSELEKYGVQPFFENNGYFQNIKLRNITFSTQSGFRLLDKNNQTIQDYKYESNFAGSSQYYHPLEKTAGLVFVGYGITAEEYGYDDYKDIDVTGKIVLMLPGEPESEDSTYFKGEKRSLHSSPSSKMANAITHGAIGIIRSSMWEKRFGWESIVSYGRKGKFVLQDEPLNISKNQIPEIVVSDSTLNDLLKYSAEPYANIHDLNGQKKPIATFEFPVQTQVNWSFDTTKTVNARNVLGLIEGNDPALKKEYVGIGAHFDHVGIGLAGVFNGADDNASGTVALLEVAKAFANTRMNKRSIFIAFHTAEEKKMLGSKYLTENTSVVKDMIAHINMDMIGCGPTDSIYSIGSDKISNEFHHLVESVNAAGVKMNFNYRFNDPGDPQRFYYRSDHYNYAKKNIPIVFFFDYEMENYHRVTDDVDKINFLKIQKVARLSFEIALTAANREEGFNKDVSTE